MVQNYVSPPNDGGEITNQVDEPSQLDVDLTRSNWQFFYAMQQESPPPGTGRRDSDASTDTKGARHVSKDRP